MLGEIEHTMRLYLHGILEEIKWQYREQINSWGLKDGEGHDYKGIAWERFLGVIELFYFLSRWCFHDSIDAISLYTKYRSIFLNIKLKSKKNML